MSGNFTQRGEVAVTDKLTRAKCACECGINLVLELPFPFSMSSADFFARSAVSIFNRLGFIDYLSFGSESGSIKSLTATANAMLSAEFKEEFQKIRDASIGYAKKCEMALVNLGIPDKIDFTPNNILGIEYIKALTVSSSKIIPHTIKRLGASYDSNEMEADELPSAMAIRRLLEENQCMDKLSAFIPNETLDIVSKAIMQGDMPTNQEKLSTAIISHFRMNPKMSTEILECDSGLYNRLFDASLKASSVSALLSLSQTKIYTNAKIRRAMWYAFFGVTSSDMNAMPSYTQLLALDKIGMSLLHSGAASSLIPILTKPSAKEGLPDKALYFKELSDKADSIYELSKPTPKHGNSAIILTPYVNNR